jgi:aminopeptidase N
VRWAISALVLATVFAVGAFLYYLSHRPPPPPAAGVPLALAEERAARITNVRYELTVRVPVEKAAPVTGHMIATFALSDASKPVAFDFTPPTDHLLAVSANQQAVEPRVDNQHIVIPSRRLVQGDNVVEFEFIAGDTALNRQNDFLYALFVPARARETLPCFDQPDIKAKWKLILQVPPDWAGIANGREAGRMTVRDKNTLSLLFDETQPLSTYLFTFAAGKFQVESAERNGRVFHMWHRETDAAKVARNKDAIFDLHAKALDWLESYTTIAYPFGKFDFVLIPSFQFGGMEHPGAVYYNANSLLLDETATQNQYLGRASVISHETAHMWFGDLVTMRWFNDVWMKEVFANFMAAKIVNPSFPEVNHPLRFLLSNYPSAYDIDRTDGANPIRQRLDNLDDAGSLYGAIIYQKAPIMMRQLEWLLGEDQMRDGLREYLKAHAFANATWPDLIQVLDARTPVDLSAWSQAWVDEPGRPVTRSDVEIADGKLTSVTLHQSDPRNRGLIWPMQVQVAIGDKAGRVVNVDVTITGATTVVPVPAGLPAPAFVLPVAGGKGYGFFDLDAKTLDYLTTSLADIKDPLLRGSALVALWECMLEGRVALDAVSKALVAALPKETNELNLSELLGDVRTLFWRFTPADDRPAAAAALEPVLRAGLDRATTTSTKATWFNTIRSVALTQPTVEWLEKIWRREASVPGLKLSENDEADLALDLAVRGVSASDEIMKTQLDRLTNADRKARFAFVTPALSRDSLVRETFFTSLKDVKNRGREAWVLEGIRFLHHPLRAGVSKKFVRPALELTWEIKRTGDIFFPKRWSDATLSGYQSVQTAAEVRALIEALPPDYPPRLRWVLQSAADPLFRAAKLLNR